MGASIIAEVGECFNGKIENAIKMIDAAADAKCDIVKFQLLDMSEVAKDDPEYDWFSKLDLPLEKINLLKQHTIEKGLDILFTPVSVNTAQTMLLAGEKKVKIASSFVRKKELLEFINDNFEIVYKKEIKYGENVKCLYGKKDGKNIIVIKDENKDKIHACVKLF